MNNISIDIYNEGASKTPFVCLHGFLETKEMWNNLHLFFIDRPILCIDLPGHGKSEIETGVQCDFSTMAKMVDELLSRLSISKFDVLGHSMGGYLSLALLEHFAEKVNKCILLNSNFLQDSEEKKKDRIRSLNILAKHPNLYLNQAFEQLFFEPIKHQHTIDLLTNRASLLSNFGIQYAIEAMMNRKNQTKLVELHRERVCMIQGEHDAMFMNPSDFSAYLPMTNWFTISSSKHMSIVEQPVQTMELICDWLEN